MSRPDLSQSPPQPLLLRPSPWRWGLIALVCAGFTVLGVLGLSRSLGAWAVIGFFGIGMLITLANLLPGVSHLAIDAQGIRLRSLFRTWQFDWHDIAAFGVTSVGMSDYVGFNYVPDYPRHLRLRKVNAGLSGFEAALPDTYELRAGQLADVLQRWHRHVGAAEPLTDPDETTNAAV